MDALQEPLLEDSMKRITMARWAAIATLALAAQGTVWAQAAPPAPVQVNGAELQAWLDADGFAVGGINLVNGCHFIAKGKDLARIQTIFCPSMAQPFTVTGEVKIVGNQMCSKFAYPDGSKFEGCQDLFKVGDNKFELRAGGTVRSIVYRLVR
jgi:hypothetical protein